MWWSAGGSSTVVIIMVVEGKIGTAGRKGWMDRVEWAGDQLEATGAIIVKSNCSTLDGCRMYAPMRDGGGEELAAMMLPCLLAGRGCGVGKKNSNSIWIFAQRTAEGSVQECKRPGEKTGE